MLQKVFENILDVELYCQMVDLIIRLSSVQHKDTIYRKMHCFFIVWIILWKKLMLFIIREKF